MAKKIEGVLTGTENGEGYELGNGKGWCDFWEGKERKFGKGKSNATLIDWGQAQHERVFTESEVRAMVLEIATTASLMQLTRSDVLRLGERHGVSPDPA
jgi:hypothetical protein